jgi:RNA polymerase II subunit A C-terminal domain phosphatase SSU72
MALLVVSLFERSLILHCVDLHNRDHVLLKTVLIVNLEVKDNHEEAAIGARLTLDLCQEVCLSVAYFLHIHMCTILVF